MALVLAQPFVQKWLCSGTLACSESKHTKVVGKCIIRNKMDMNHCSHPLVHNALWVLILLQLPMENLPTSFKPFNELGKPANKF